MFAQQTWVTAGSRRQVFIFTFRKRGAKVGGEKKKKKRWTATIRRIKIVASTPTFLLTPMFVTGEEKQRLICVPRSATRATDRGAETVYFEFEVEQ